MRHHADIRGDQIAVSEIHITTRDDTYLISAVKGGIFKVIIHIGIRISDITRAGVCKAVGYAV